MKRVGKYLKLPWKEKLFFIEVTFLLVVIKGMIVLLPFRMYRKMLGIQNENFVAKPVSNSTNIIFSVARAIVRSRKVLPWKSLCLTEAIVAKILLRRRGVASTLFLGVNKENNSMTAHAWLCCGEIFVVGKKGVEKFKVVSTFS